jgi:hypothetical protein
VQRSYLLFAVLLVGLVMFGVGYGLGIGSNNDVQAQEPTGTWQLPADEEGLFNLFDNEVDEFIRGLDPGCDIQIESYGDDFFLVAYRC